MRTRVTFLKRVLSAAPLMLAAISCATAAGPTPTGAITRPLTPMSQHIDGLRIRRSGATTAWDVLRIVAPFQSRDLRTLPTRRPEMAAGSGVMGLVSPRVIVDGVPLVDPGLLRAMPARELISIDLVGAMDAVSLFGQSFGGGAIVIRTQRHAAERRAY